MAISSSKVEPIIKEKDSLVRASSHRLRRLRQASALRSLVSETDVNPRNLLMPIFVREGNQIKEEIASMPGIFRLSPDEYLDKEVAEIESLGIGGVLIFGIPNKKDALGSEAHN